MSFVKAFIDVLEILLLVSDEVTQYIFKPFEKFVSQILTRGCEWG